MGEIHPRESYFSNSGNCIRSSLIRIVGKRSPVRSETFSGQTRVSIALTKKHAISVLYRSSP